MSRRKRGTAPPPKPQPCWNCRKYAGGCSWSRSFTPIPGWDAEPTGTRSGLRTDSYQIIRCPEFEDDHTARGAKKEEQL